MQENRDEGQAPVPADVGRQCPLQKQYGEIVCRDGVLWALTYSECAPPDQRQAWGDCPHCKATGA